MAVTLASGGVETTGAISQRAAYDAAPMVWRRPLRRLRGPSIAAVALALLALPQAAMATDTGIEAESMTFTGNGAITNESSASGGHALGIWSNGYASASVTTTDPSTFLFVRARGDQCNGAPI